MSGGQVIGTSLQAPTPGAAVNLRSNKRVASAVGASQSLSGAAVTFAQSAMAKAIARTLSGVSLTFALGALGTTYALPGPGESLDVAATNAARDLIVSGFDGNAIDYSMYSSYSGPIFIRDGSTLGIVVWCCKGGHQHPDLTGAIYFDLDDLTFKSQEHTNGGTKYSASDLWFDLPTETNGFPLYEIGGSPSNGVPAPGHGYKNMAELPASLGGGAKGTYLVVGRTAMGALGTTTSKYVHGFDIATGAWTLKTASPVARAGNETTVVYDAPRGRYWYLTRDGTEGDSYVPYLRISDWTWQTDASWFGFSSLAEWGGGGSAWMHAGYLFLQAGDGTLLVFDPDDTASKWRLVTISGSAGSTLPNNFNKFEYYPRTGKFYYVSKSGGATLNRLTPPNDPIGGTWTHDTVSIAPALTEMTWIGDGAHNTQHYTSLMYIPTIDRLAWFPGGTEPPQLLDPI